MRPKHYGTIKDGEFKRNNEYKWRRDLKSLGNCSAYVVIRKNEPTIHDPLRKYYFKVCMKIIADKTGLSMEVCHDNMKQKFSSEIDEKTGFIIIKSVFSNESEMPVSEKKEFIKRVREWAWDFFSDPDTGQGLYIPEYGEVEA